MATEKITAENNEEKKNTVSERRTTVPYFRIFSPFASFLDSNFDDFGDEEGLESMMKTDYIDEGEKIALEIEVPGVEKKDIKLTVNDGYLTLKAVYVHKKESENRRVIRHERMYGSFTRNYYVGENITKSDIEASLENGLLTVRFPKSKQTEEEDNSIEIK